MTDAYQATLDPRVAPQGDALAARGSADPLDAAYDRNMAAIERSMAAEQQIAREQSGALAKPRAELAAMNRQPLPQPPQPRQMPAAPQARNEPGADETWLMAASVLGAIAGGLTRQHVTNALGAMTGALEGYQQGSKQRFEQQLQQWKAEGEKAREENQAANERYTQILQSRKMALDQKLQEIELTAAQYQDRAMMQLAQTRNLETMGRMILARGQQDAKMAQAAATMKEKYAQMEQRERLAQEANASRERAAAMRATGVTSPEQFNSLVDAIGKYDQPPVPGRYGLAIMNAVHEKYPDYDARKYTQSNRAMGAFGAGPEARTLRSLNVSIAHLDTLDQLGQALQTGNVQLLNQVRNRFRQEFGQDAPTKFDAAKQIVGAEIIKAVAASGGGVTERQEAADHIKSANSPAQLRGVISTYKQLLAGQLEGLRKQYEDTTMRSDFESRLTPSARRELEPLQPPQNGGGEWKNLGTDPKTGEPIRFREIGP